MLCIQIEVAGTISMTDQCECGSNISSLKQRLDYLIWFNTRARLVVSPETRLASYRISRHY